MEPSFSRRRCFHYTFSNHVIARCCRTRSSRMVAIAMQKPNTTRESPAQVAGLGLIRAAVKNPDGTSHLILQGLCRLKLGRATKYRPYRIHEAKPLQTTGNDSV